MTTGSPPPIWDFVLAYYGQKGFSEAAIALQDSSGVDVNMILFLMWMSAQRKTLSTEDARAIGETSHKWQKSVVIPIRAIRRLLKDSAPLVQQETALAYRKKVQALEIEGEQLQLNAMADAAKAVKSGTASSSEQAARDNLTAFSAYTGVTIPPASIDTFLRALAGVTNAA
ncbi:MAG TPA: TIGR02444 family protein [Xanthobacteraceae bacterium]|nr:TIGR02444 family protein [Xanthobacteraceae bacterium]